MTEIGHNEAAGEDLRERANAICDVLDEIAERQEKVKQLYAEANGARYNAAVLKRVVKELREDEVKAASRQESERLLALYRHHLGLLDGTPMGNFYRMQMEDQGAGGPTASRLRAQSKALEGGV